MSARWCAVRATEAPAHEAHESIRPASDRLTHSQGDIPIMLANLSVPQRLALFLLSLAVAQGVPFIGLNLGWSAAWVAPTSLLSTLLAVFVVFDSALTQ